MRLVQVLGTKMGVINGSQDLEDTVVDGLEGDIDSSSTEIVDDDVGSVGTTGFFRLVETVDDGGGGGGLLNESEDVEAGGGKIRFNLRLGILSALRNSNGIDSLGGLLVVEEVLDEDRTLGIRVELPTRTLGVA
ncbi:hypothetical protein FRC01_012967 [Tulasnella sp. 417]|nr:hypothetical protein FRC01_012967 [Tulasnella sp. 417]